MYTGERVTVRPMLHVTIAQGSAAYQFVSRVARGRTVLDVACGDGYGASILAETSAEVLAVDRDARTIANARARYPKANLSFLAADLERLPGVIGGRTFDIVCSFQFIEHLADQASFIAALRAFVRPGGIIAVSTPNRRMFPTFNPYHVRELDQAELAALFARDFSDVQLFGVFGDQAVLRYRASKQRLGKWILHADVLRARDWLPQPILRRVYDGISFLVMKRVSFWRHRALVSQITTDNFAIRADDLNHALDLIALATVPAGVRTESPQQVSVGTTRPAPVLIPGDKAR